MIRPRSDGVVGQLDSERMLACANALIEHLVKTYYVALLDKRAVSSYALDARTVRGCGRSVSRPLCEPNDGRRRESRSTWRYGQRANCGAPVSRFDTGGGRKIIFRLVEWVAIRIDRGPHSTGNHLAGHGDHAEGSILLARRQRLWTPSAMSAVAARVARRSDCDLG
jgi:hypothetical protein